MRGGFILTKLYRSQLSGVALCIISFLTILGCANEPASNEFEIREDMLFVKGQNKLFTGKVIDTVAQKILEYEVVEGKKNGQFKISYPDGSVEMVGKIKDNLNEGEWCYYYPNGQLESVGNFKNNLSEGKWIWYYESGKIKEIGFFQSGKKNGDWTVYDEKGNIIRKLFFKEGQVTDDKKYDKELLT